MTSTDWCRGLWGPWSGFGVAAALLLAAGSVPAAAGQGAGDFNGDGRDDLAIGVPFENGAAGAVNVLYGSKKGLKAKKSQLWHQNTKGIAEQAALGDWFGFTLTAGHFNKGKHRDLAIGVPNEDLLDSEGLEILNAGAVNVIYGTKKGLKAKGDQLWHQNKLGGEDGAEADDIFGRALPGSPAEF